MESRFEAVWNGLQTLKPFHRVLNGFPHLRRWDGERWAMIEDPRLWGNHSRECSVEALRWFRQWSEAEQEVFAQQIEVDAYFSMNTGDFYAGSTQLNPAPEDYSYINSAFVDLNCGHAGGEGLPDERAVDLVDELVASEALPAYSAVELTGTGLRVYWWLREPPDSFSNSKPVSCSGGDKARSLVPKLNRALIERVKATPELGVDKDAVSIALFQRFPGSLNSKSGKIVRYELGDTPRYYTLEELGSFLEVEPREEGSSAPSEPRVATVASLSPRLEEERETASSPSAGHQESGSGKSASKKEAGRERFRQLWEEYELIEKSRGGFSGDCWNDALFYGVIIMKEGGWEEAAIGEKLEYLNGRCLPNLPPLGIDDLFTRGMRKRKFGTRPPSNRTIAKALQVTAGEAERLGLTKIRPDFKYRPSAGIRGINQATRERKYLELVDEDGKLRFGLREMSRKLGGDVSHNTVRKDLVRLGMSWRE